jgi:hypothetical protein
MEAGRWCCVIRARQPVIYKGPKKGDPNAPPVFESQAAYLDWYKLLSDDERKSLPADAFEPVPFVED